MIRAHTCQPTGPDDEIRTTYYAILRVGDLKSRRRFDKYREAKAWHDKEMVRLRELKKHPHLRTEAHTFGEALDYWLAFLAKAPPKRGARVFLKADGTPKVDKAKQTREGIVKWWRDRYGTVMLDQLSPNMFDRARGSLETEPYGRQKPHGHRTSIKKGEAPTMRLRSHATVKNYLGVASAALACVIRQEHWMALNPLDNVAMPAASRKIKRTLEEDKIPLLLKHCAAHSHDLEDLVLMGLCTGARAGELLRMRWSGIDWKMANADVGDQKNDDDVPIHLPPAALEVLQRRDAARKAEKVRDIGAADEWVFPHIGGRNADDYRPPFLKAVRAAGIVKFRFHDLRHTTAGYAAMSGASLPEVQALLRHKSSQSTERYIDLLKSHMKEVSDKAMDKMFGTASKSESA